MPNNTFIKLFKNFAGNDVAEGEGQRDGNKQDEL